VDFYFIVLENIMHLFEILMFSVYEQYPTPSNSVNYAIM